MTKRIAIVPNHSPASANTIIFHSKTYYLKKKKVIFILSLIYVNMVAVGKPLKGMHITDSLPELILKYQQTERRKKNISTLLIIIHQ